MEAENPRPPHLLVTWPSEISGNVCLCKTTILHPDIGGVQKVVRICSTLREEEMLQQQVYIGVNQEIC